MIRRVVISPALFLLSVSSAVGCSHGNSGTVHPTDMSAEAHREEASKENAAAQRELRQANTLSGDTKFAQKTGGGNPDAYYYGPSRYEINNDHLSRARELMEHARQHAAAAAQLEKFEDAQCGQFPPSTRAACPLLGPVTRISDIPHGVLVEFTRDTKIDAVVAHMRCHLAFAQTQGFEVASACPLYMKGIDIARGVDPLTIQIVSKDPKVTREIRVRAREEAVVVRRGGA